MGQGQSVMFVGMKLALGNSFQSFVQEVGCSDWRLKPKLTDINKDCRLGSCPIKSSLMFVLDLETWPPFITMISFVMLRMQRRAQSFSLCSKKIL
ncbi:Uncharacterized protein TCM_027311 [Theobroma cacao]|uniref:Uncharacterized protein n=1 Tax=Theobroma cacao TaxID=3641 RepID=A0A061G9W4_THECC|nr:Uncharacterized protein TCM_027311 [Theobroma cacao]